MQSGLRGQLLDVTLRSPDSSIYLLVDTTLGDPLANVATRATAVAVPIRHPDLKRDHHPYLLRLGEIGRDPAIDTSLALGLAQALRSPEGLALGRSICLWLVSDSDIDVVAHHLAARAKVRVGSETRLFRFWDPRVMDALEHLLRPMQAGSLLGPVSSCLWLTRSGSLASLRVADAKSDEAIVDGLRLDQRQLDHLARVELINRALDVLQDMERTVLGAEVRTVLGGLIEKGAREWTLRTDRELVTYALYGVLVHQRFDREPGVAEAMDQARRAGTSPIDALEQFDESYWQALAGKADGCAEAARTA
ncbi:protein of unknown function [Lysobacter sp. yr284]|uniref:DUF4123 domain-containing protein n=1 Tax=Lysobacter sp. yr284 TaxID=1761791 RepID=UPI0008967A72|nr:DUF4123 domain-containing protein [Lysobacter sp. yr284]SDY78825.1 protein of unknown function [Lysobacter sp. yr284]